MKLSQQQINKIRRGARRKYLTNTPAAKVFKDRKKESSKWACRKARQQE